MQQKIQTPPTPQDIGEKIIHNLNRLQGFLNVLLEEIDDPSKQGPGFERNEWKQKTTQLQKKLAQLDAVLKSTSWE